MAKKPKEGLEGYCPQKHSKTSIKKVGMCKLIHPSIHPTRAEHTLNRLKRTKTNKPTRPYHQSLIPPSGVLAHSLATHHAWHTENSQLHVQRVTESKSKTKKSNQEIRTRMRREFWSSRASELPSLTAEDLKSTEFHRASSPHLFSSRLKVVLLMERCKHLWLPKCFPFVCLSRKRTHQLYLPSPLFSQANGRKVFFFFLVSSLRYPWSCTA